MTNFHDLTISALLPACVGSIPLTSIPGVGISYTPTIGGLWGHVETVLVVVHAPAQRPRRSLRHEWPLLLSNHYHGYLPDCDQWPAHIIMGGLLVHLS